MSFGSDSFLEIIWIIVLLSVHCTGLPDRGANTWCSRLTVSYIASNDICGLGCLEAKTHSHRVGIPQAN